MSYKAFVSSTFEDLAEHRRAVIAALRKAGVAVDPMEDWTAAIGEPKTFSQDRLRDCDLCVLLVGFRRGHVPEGEELSITQLEYQAAVRARVGVLVFMLHADSPWPRKFDERDRDPGIRQFRNELKEHKGVSFFGLEPNSIEVLPAVARWIAERGQLRKEDSCLNNILRRPDKQIPAIIGETDLLITRLDLDDLAFDRNLPAGFYTKRLGVFVRMWIGVTDIPRTIRAFEIEMSSSDNVVYRGTSERDVRGYFHHYQEHTYG